MFNLLVSKAPRSLDIAASVSLIRPFIILIGQKFSQITSRFTKSTDFSNASSRQSGKPSKASSGTAPNGFSQKEPSHGDDDILLRDIYSAPYDPESGRHRSQQIEPAGIYKTVEVSVNGDERGHTSIPPSSFL